MDVKTFDLRILVIKYDLEKALLETYQDEKIILNENERKTIQQYLEDDYDVLKYVRDLLIEREQFEETKIVLNKAINQTLQIYPSDNTLYYQIEELSNNFISSINTNTGNNNCLFLPKSRILK